VEKLINFGQLGKLAGMAIIIFNNNLAVSFYFSSFLPCRPTYALFLFDVLCMSLYILFSLYRRAFCHALFTIQEGLAVDSIARDDPSPLPGIHRDHNAR